MRFNDQFQTNDKILGKLRAKYMKRVEKDIGSFLDYKSAYFPIVEETEKRSGLSRLTGKTQAHKLKERSILFSARVANQNFESLVGGISPISLGRGVIVFEEYTYTTLLPYPSEKNLVYIEKKGVFRGKKGFYTTPHSIQDQVKITDDLLFQSSGEESLAFKLAKFLQMVRNDKNMRDLIDQVIKAGTGQNHTSNYLNDFKPLHKEIKKFAALSEAQKGKIKVADELGVTTILLPVGNNTLAQVGDFNLNPARAIKVLNYLAVGLYEANKLAVSSG